MAGPQSHLHHPCGGRVGPFTRTRQLRVGITVRRRPPIDRDEDSLRGQLCPGAGERLAWQRLTLQSKAR